jgi:regulator of protease activity HflC (stomatin/prohibitin superfamily)
MSDRDLRERDILVASNEYAYVQDLTKGDIVLYVGPTKISLSNTERLVDFRDGRFVPLRGDEGGVSPFVAASSSQYIVLENPPKDASVRPLKGNNGAVELLVGRRIVVPGPATFPLWPGQRARVIGGHGLREDQYLLVRCYDAIEGYGIGNVHVVRGTDTTYYVPPTGLEVLPQSDGTFVRLAHRLTKSTGLHLRVAKSFVAQAGDQVPPGRYEAGQDVFLSNVEGYFFPTEHLEVVGYVRALPIAFGDGVYVRDLATGHIATVVGPVNFLPDPTREEIVTRTVPEPTKKLWNARQEAGRALAVAIPSGFAVQVVGRGSREVVRGPETRILHHDEELEVLELSTGKPKSQERLLRTSFLQIDGNKVSDGLVLKTADHNEVEVTVSYRVSFLPAKDGSLRWFQVKDYVALLCDHAGSLLRAAVRSTPLETFYRASTEILRGAILGEKAGADPRPGRYFDENGMWIYDVEVLDVRILDPEVQSLIGDAQRNAIVADVNRRQEMLRLDTERLKEEVSRSVYDAQIETLARAIAHEEERRKLVLAQARSQLDLESTERLERARVEANAYTVGATAKADALAREHELEKLQLEARAHAFKEQMAALQPELVTTLKMLGNQKLAGELSKNLAPLAILGGESVGDVVERLLGAMPVGAATTVAEVLPKKRA